MKFRDQIEAGLVGVKRIEFFDESPGVPAIRIYWDTNTEEDANNRRESYRHLAMAGVHSLSISLKANSLMNVVLIEEGTGDKIELGDVIYTDSFEWFTTTYEPQTPTHFRMGLLFNEQLLERPEYGVFLRSYHLR